MALHSKYPFNIFVLILLVFPLIYCKPGDNIAGNGNTILSSVSAQPQDEPPQDYYSKEYFRTEDHIYKKNIRTVLFHRLGWELSSPIIEFGSNDKLLLSFDDLEADVKEYRYRIMHCDAGWQQDNLSEFEYLDGFGEDYINQYLPSYNTIQPYTHYWLEFPSEKLMPKISGNYLLIVYVDGFPDDPVITKRFCIFEQRVSIKARISGANLLEDRRYKQEVDFDISTRGYEIDNIYTGFHVVILQNGRWDNAIQDLKPVIIKGSELNYNHDFNNTFNGGNEYRFFDIKSFKYTSERVYKHAYVSGTNETYLYPDERRPYKVYVQQSDINGQLYIKTEDGDDSRTEGEYTWVNFYLPYEFPLINGNIYIFGKLTQWQFTNEGKMVFDYGKGRYTARMYLKQGYYNYQYVFLPDGQPNGDETMIEGNHAETENDYTIMVYNRESGERYDRLVGISQFNSLENR